MVGTISYDRLAIIFREQLGNERERLGAMTTETTTLVSRVAFTIDEVTEREEFFDACHP